jgi:purine-binding chemotaxis protein CheW
MEKQIVIFELGNELYGIDIASVEGIVKMQAITRLPYTPDYMEGITNLRGSVIPIIDLCKRFGMQAGEETNETRIITVNMDTVKMGMIVSAVTEVLTIDDSVVEIPQGMALNVKVDFITGVARLEKRLVILLDLTRILSADEKQTAEKLIEGI